jgi:hypothetical protein
VACACPAQEKPSLSFRAGEAVLYFTRFDIIQSTWLAVPLNLIRNLAFESVSHMKGLVEIVKALRKRLKEGFDHHRFLVGMSQKCVSRLLSQLV